MAARAAQSPTLFILEDLQWADPSTLELTKRIVERKDTSPLLSVLSHRSEFDLPWIGHMSTVRLELGRLTDEQSETMIAQMTGQKAPS